MKAIKGPHLSSTPGPLAYRGEQAAGGALAGHIGEGADYLLPSAVLLAK